MPVDIQLWTETFCTRLREVFGSRLLFVGLQGSWQRGEASESSDIDMVVILDEVGMNDLKTYRNLVSGMPESDKACGFIGGREELLKWPRGEVFQLYYDTRPLVGRLDSFLPPFTKEDARAAVMAGAAALYHGACHACLYDACPAQALPGLRKGAFFTLQALHFLETGTYIRTNKEMATLRPDPEKRLFTPPAEEAAEKDFRALIAWSGSLLKRFGA